MSVQETELQMDENPNGNNQLVENQSNLAAQGPSNGGNGPPAPGTGLESVETREEEEKKLSKKLKRYFYLPFKRKGDTCYIHLLFCVVFLLQIIKVVLLTWKMYNFGNDRGNFSIVVNRGHLVLQHLLLENWDASRETLPYPPAQGELAVYEIGDLESGINYAVKNYYNAEAKAIGYFIRTPDDNMTAEISYFNFPGSNDTNVNDTNVEEGITISADKKFPIDKGLTTEVTTENQTVYNYDVAREFDHYNLSQPIKRMLSMTLHFHLHSVRSHESSNKATCLRVEGWVSFKDLDKNGQVLVDLKTKSRGIKCKDMNLSLSDWHYENISEVIGVSVIVFTVISLAITIATIVLMVYTIHKTVQYVEQYNVKLPASEYFHFFNIWDMIVILSDILTLCGTVMIVFYTVHSEWELELLDRYTVLLGIGSVLAWLSLLRYFKFDEKLHLVFITLYKAFWNVLVYFTCICVLFIGFWTCGYVVLAPYNAKFRTPTATADTLFAIVSGDDIYATLAILESDKSYLIWWFARFYIGTYVAIFTIVVINFLMELFKGAYESVKMIGQDQNADQQRTTLEELMEKGDSKSYDCKCCNVTIL